MFDFQGSCFSCTCFSLSILGYAKNNFQNYRFTWVILLWWGSPIYLNFTGIQSDLLRCGYLDSFAGEHYSTQKSLPAVLPELPYMSSVFQEWRRKPSGQNQAHCQSRCTWLFKASEEAAARSKQEAGSIQLYFQIKGAAHKVQPFLAHPPLTKLEINTQLSRKKKARELRDQSWALENVEYNK